MIVDHADAWSHFLHARKLILDELLRQPEHTFETVAQVLSMDPIQVHLISMTDVDTKRYGDTGSYVMTMVEDIYRYTDVHGNVWRLRPTHDRHMPLIISAESQT